MAAFVLGALGLKFPWPMAGGLAVLVLCSWRAFGSLYRLASIPLVFALGFGWATYQMPVAPEAMPSWMASRQKVEISALVDEVQSLPNQRLNVILTRISFQTKKGESGTLPGRLLLTLESPKVWPEAGQHCNGTLRIKPVHSFANPGATGDEFHWHRQGVFWRAFVAEDKEEITFEPASQSLRAHLRETFLASAKPDQGRAVALALTTGDRFYLDQPTVTLMQDSSLAHSLALSGLNLCFVASLGWLIAWIAGRIRPEIFLRIPRAKLAVILAAPLVLTYLWLGQGIPSLERAGWMFFFWGLLVLADRDNVILDGLFFALAAMLLFSPLSAYDLSLQLSALAVAGIGLFWPLAAPWINALRAKGVWGRLLIGPTSILVISLATNVMLLPLMLWYFGQASLHLYLNLLWLPPLGWVVQPLALIGLGVSQIPGLHEVGSILIQAGSLTAEVMLNWLFWVKNQGWIPIWLWPRPLWPQMAGYWLGLLGLVVFFAAGWRKRAVALWLTGMALFVWPLAQSAFESKGQIRLTMLDVGQGQSMLLETDQGRFLIDGGGSWDRDFDVGRIILAPALTFGRWPSLSKVILSHPDSDHMRGLFFVLDRFKVEAFAHNGDPPQGEDAVILPGILARRGIPIQVWSAGTRLDVGSGAVLEVLHPAGDDLGLDDNDRSLVVRLSRNGQGLALIPGDLGRKGMAVLLERGTDLAAQILVLPHHGSKTGFSPEFIDRVSPRIALASTGFLNQFFFPNKDVLGALNEKGIEVLTTAERGAVTITWGPIAIDPVVRWERKGR